MKVVILGEDVDLTAAVAQAAIEMDATPLIAGREAVLVAQTAAEAGSTVMKVQTSDDNVNWTDVLTLNADTPVRIAQLKLAKYLRLNVTTAGTAGTGSAYLFASA
ncbi:MAG TPA: hypothetical protein VFP95_07140 [Gammaproteobacteria bacterium]|nr:hypothetical protein [Gammaproteobacteria bacterium]